MEPRRKKKTKTGAKLDIFLSYTPPRNEGDFVRIKTSLWMPEFGR